jgi:DtxR family Mn-dependent transcriptional regulator
LHYHLHNQCIHSDFNAGDMETIMYNPLIALLIGLLLMALLSLLFWPNGGLIGYTRRVRQFSDRVLREDALKHIHRCERHNIHATLESLAGALSITTTHAADLMNQMQEQELIIMDGETFLLTPEGRDYALRIIRAHRIMERYLADETGHNEAAWHDLAERYEHDLSPSEVDALSAQLGNPTHDPHGDPIPTANGAMRLHGGEPLSNMPVGASFRIVHIEDEPETVYAQIAAEGLYPGMEVRLAESTPKRVRFWASDGEEHLLAPVVASSISVSEIPIETVEIESLGEPLHTLHPGQQGEVVELSPRLRGSERRRMMDLGILPGTFISAEMLSPSGDPQAYRIRGALIALRKEQAELIRIKTALETAS